MIFVTLVKIKLITGNILPEHPTQELCQIIIIQVTFKYYIEVTFTKLAHVFWLILNL